MSMQSTATRSHLEKYLIFLDDKNMKNMLFSHLVWPAYLPTQE